MILLSAILLAVSTACVLWYFLHSQQIKSLVSERVANVPSGLHLPFSLTENTQVDASGEGTISLDESYGNKTARRLYVAGIRSHKAIKTFNSILRLCYLLPIGLTLYGTVSGDFSLIFAIKSFVVGCVLFFLAHFYIRMRHDKRQKDITLVLPQLFDLLIVSLEAGLNFTAAMPRVLMELDNSNSLVKEFQAMHHEYLGGLPLPQACDRLARRCESPDLAVILSSIVESEHLGSSLSHILRIHSQELRDKYRQRLREKAHQLPVKLLFPMLLIFITIFTMALGPAIYRFNNMNSDISK